MDNESLKQNTNQIDWQELLIRFIHSCKKDTQMYSADIISAVYYYRRYPKAEDFINSFLAENQDYFQIQWVRSTWAYLSKMSDVQLCDLVINQITLVDNSKEEQ